MRQDYTHKHLDYLKQYRRVTYTNLLTSGRLNAYLTDIDKQAQELFERLIDGMKQAQFPFYKFTIKYIDKHTNSMIM